VYLFIYLVVDIQLNFIYYGIIFQLLVIFICFVADIYIFIYNYRLLLSLTLALVLSLTLIFIA